MNAYALAVISHVCTATFDYVPTNGSKVFNGSTSRQCAEVTIINDSAVENSEDFTISISSDDNAVQFGVSVATIVILDDGDSTLSLLTCMCVIYWSMFTQSSQL